MSKSLLERWRALAGDGADELGEALIAAYAEPQRVYHDQSHLIWLLDEVDRVGGRIADVKLVGYAIWFHDAIYQPGEPDNEARSAEWARSALAVEPALAANVAALVLKTKRHREGDAEGDEAIFLDMDMAILGEPWATYCGYAAGIRREYPNVVDPAFAAGRGAFLEAQLQDERVFRTDFYEAERGDTARANMRWELEEMRKGRMVKG